jgi:hypothetical protein
MGMRYFENFWLSRLVIVKPHEQRAKQAVLRRQIPLFKPLVSEITILYPKNKKNHKKVNF